MKKILSLAIILTVTVTHLLAQSGGYNVVFDLTSKDTLVQKAAIRWVTEISQGYPDAKLEVVLYGKSLDMITQGKSHFDTQVKSLLQNKNVSFKVCAIAMKNNHVDKSQLIQGVEIVPDGIREVVSKQHEGWGYIKVAM